jgi:hypothetical protein
MVHKAFHNHNKESTFLGHSKSDSDRWLADVRGNEGKALFVDRFF